MANPNQTHQQSLYPLQVHAAAPAAPSPETQKTHSKMMIGEHNRPNAILHVSPWSLMGDPPSATCLPYPLTGGDFSDGNATTGGDLSDYNLVLSALQRYLPSNEAADDDIASASVSASGDLSGGLESDFPVDAFSSDQFRMFEFKVRRCARGRSHDWTDCPYAHPGEKARRRDPRKYHYSGTACADFRKGSCRKGDACEFAHGVFECWLHPARYRTQPCKDGTSCRRRVCFFAHTPEQLRVLPQQSPVPGTSAAELYDGSPLRQALDARAFPYASSPGSGSISPPESPPMSPITAHPLSRSLGSNSVCEMVSSLRKLQLSKMKSFPSSWGVQAASPTGFGSPSPRGPILPPGSYSLPSTPTRTATRPGLVGCLEFWEECCEEEAGVEMERVDSGRNLRATMFEKLSKENSLDRVDGGHSATTGGPDVGWVSELVNYISGSTINPVNTIFCGQREGKSKTFNVEDYGCKYCQYFLGCGRGG